MFRFENPLDPSRDGTNPFIDGIRYNIRNSEAIKEEIMGDPYHIEQFVQYIRITNTPMTALDILEKIVYHLGYSLNDLTIADEHELLDYLTKFF